MDDIQYSRIEKYILNRVHNQNANFLCVLNGPPGSGKTYCALRLAERLDKNFTTDQVVFDVESFVMLLRSGKLRTGSCIVFDEAGVSANNREWQSKANKAINFIAQTFRHRNYIVLFTAPVFDFVDKSIRRLFHAVFQTQRIDHVNNYCIVKPLFTQSNAITGKVYLKFLQYKVGNRKSQISRMSVSLPSKELRDSYEIRKAEFTHALYNDLAKDLNLETDDAKVIQGKPLTDQQAKAVFLKVEHGLTDSQIAEVLGGTRSNVSKLIRAARARGWVIPTAPEVNDTKQGTSSVKLDVRTYKAIVSEIEGGNIHEKLPL